MAATSWSRLPSAVAHGDVLHALFCATSASINATGVEMQGGTRVPVRGLKGLG